MNILIKLFVSIILFFVILANHNTLEKIDNKIKDKFTNYTCVMLGTSITANNKWKIKNQKIKNMGRGGFTTSHHVMRIQEVLSYSPSILIIEGGINDIGVGVSTERTIYNINTLINKSKEYNITPIVIEIIKVSKEKEQLNKDIDLLNNKIKSICIALDVQYIQVNQELAPNGYLLSNYTSDGIHLTKEGYIVFENIINRELIN